MLWTENSDLEKKVHLKILHPLQEQHVAMNPNPSLSFGELPSFADSILYPEKRQHQIPDPTTRATFQGRPGPRADPCEKLQGNIRLEGEYTCTWRVSAHVPGG